MDIGNNAFELYGPIIRFWISIVPYFIVSDPNMLQVIIGSTKHTNKNIFYDILHNFIGDGLITSSGNIIKLINFY